MIAVELVPEGYTARVTPPHGTWETLGPLPLRELIDALQDHGCHQQDIGDALFEADPDWPSRL